MFDITCDISSDLDGESEVLTLGRSLFHGISMFSHQEGIWRPRKGKTWHMDSVQFTGWLQVNSAWHGLGSQWMSMVMMVSCGPISTLCHDEWKSCRFWSCASVSKPLQEPVLPEMPFAPPEGDYGEDSEMTENLEQFRHEQGRDTLVSTSGSSGSSYQAGQMFMGTWRPKGGIRYTILIYTAWFIGKF